MRDGHPKPDLLVRFLSGEASGAERRAVVRHLLTGCRECLAVTRPVWDFTAHVLERKGGSPMADAETAARTELLLIGQDLETLRYRLLGVRASLREGSTESSTELKVRIGHLIDDRLLGLFEDLMATAEYRPEDEPGAP